MTLRWNARGDSASTLIMWLVTLTATIICGYWLVSHVRPYHTIVKNVDNELEVLQEFMSTSCDMDYYNWKYNPKLKRGNVHFRTNQICINSDNCNVIYYEGNATPIIEDNILRMNRSAYCTMLQKCRPFYYSSDSEPVFTAGEVTIDDADSCFPDQPLIRCLPLVCDINATYDVNLRDLVHILVLKEDGVYTFSKELV